MNIPGAGNRQPRPFASKPVRWENTAKVSRRSRKGRERRLNFRAGILSSAHREDAGRRSAGALRGLAFFHLAANREELQWPKIIIISWD